MLMLVVLLVLGGPLGTQRRRLVNEPRSLSCKRARPLPIANVPGCIRVDGWYDEGARAVLTLDVDRLEYAVQQEVALLFSA